MPTLKRRICQAFIFQDVKTWRKFLHLDTDRLCDGVVVVLLRVWNHARHRWLLHQMQNGRFPASLGELKSLSVSGAQPLAPDQLMPHGGKPFGYQLENDHAVLWGFDLMKEHCTPDQIPDYSTSSELPLWVWRLQATGQEP